jgi:hypothetical protein
VSLLFTRREKAPIVKGKPRCQQCQTQQRVHDGRFCSACGYPLEQNSLVIHENMFLANGLSLLLATGSCTLWGTALKYINVRAMNDLGLISVIPPQIIIALSLLSLSFCLLLFRQQSKLFMPLILLHVAILIFMLYGITALVEEQPRFTIVYRHAGYTEFIMRTQTVDPSLDAYFNWPVFFILTAFVTQIAGYHTLLSYAAWATVFYNVLYFWPLYSILQTATTDKRIIWLAIWFFYITNWIGQDYISPQGLNFFLYLAILALVLRWFKIPQPTIARPLAAGLQRPGPLAATRQWLANYLRAPDDLVQSAPRQQQVILIIITILIFGLIMTSHPLTPFFVLASLLGLTIFRRSGPFWLPFLLGILTVTWMLLMTQTYLTGHFSDVLGDTGQINNVIAENVTGRLHGNLQHTLINELRVGMTLLLWLLGSIGAYCRLRRGYHDLSYIILAIAPFPLMLLQAYGGEMLMRVYLFISPSMVFFAASLFFNSPQTHNLDGHAKKLRRHLATIAITLLLLGGFLFTRYGNENMDYMTNAEVAGVLYMYHSAPRNSMLISIWDGTPWQLEYYERYNLITLNEDVPSTFSKSDAKAAVNTLVDFIQQKSPPSAYLIISRSQIATAESQGISAATLQRFERELVTSGQFVQLYHNQDAHIFLFKHSSQDKK